MECFEDLLFNFSQFFLIIGSIDNQLFFLLLQIGILLFYDDSEELIGQAFEGDHEIEEGHFGGDFGEVVGVTELGGQVELEVLVVFDDAITDLDVVTSSTFHNLLLK